jgi:hypothetical protein
LLGIFVTKIAFFKSEKIVFFVPNMANFKDKKFHLSEGPFFTQVTTLLTNSQKQACHYIMRYYYTNLVLFFEDDMLLFPLNFKNSPIFVHLLPLVEPFQSRNYQYVRTDRLIRQKIPGAEYSGSP